MKLAVSFNNYHVLFGPVLLETLDLNCHMFDGKLGKIKQKSQRTAFS